MKSNFVLFYACFTLYAFSHSRMFCIGWVIETQPDAELCMRHSGGKPAYLRALCATEELFPIWEKPFYSSETLFSGISVFQPAVSLLMRCCLFRRNLVPVPEILTGMLPISALFIQNKVEFICNLPCAGISLPELSCKQENKRVNEYERLGKSEARRNQ